MLQNGSRHFQLTSGTSIRAIEAGRAAAEQIQNEQSLVKLSMHGRLIKQFSLTCGLLAVSAGLSRFLRPSPPSCLPAQEYVKGEHFGEYMLVISFYTT